jgi:hypothetical protein
MQKVTKITEMDDKRHLGAFEQIRALLSIARGRLGRMLTSFDGSRNYNEIFGWDNQVSIEQILTMYERGGIAKRLVDSYPDAIWSRPPLIWMPGNDAWTAEFKQWIDDINLWTALYRLDKLARLGQYAIMLVGTDRPALEQPLRNATRITYLQPYGEQSVTIEDWDRDPTSRNFGKPLLYRIFPEGSGFTPRNTGSSVGRGGGGTGSIRSSFLVHASRIIHVAHGVLENEVFGQPAMLPSWDYLTDLRKVVGSSSESYWIMANRGLQADIDKEMSLNAEDQAALQTEIEEFFHGFRRFVRTKGVKLNELNNDVADPKGPFDVLITLISGTSGIPKRILLGSEAGQLASTQDKGNWAERVEEERALASEPSIIKPFIRWTLQNGLIKVPNPVETVTQQLGMQITWPDAYRMSPLERGQTAAQTARTLANITKMLESESPRVRNLITDIEARALIGLSSDNRILEDNPEP